MSGPLSPKSARTLEHLLHLGRRRKGRGVLGVLGERITAAESGGAAFAVLVVDDPAALDRPRDAPGYSALRGNLQTLHEVDIADAGLTLADRLHGLADRRRQPLGADGIEQGREQVVRDRVVVDGRDHGTVRRSLAPVLTNK